MRKKKNRDGGFFFFSIKGCVRYKVLFPAVVKYSFTSSFFSHGTQKKKKEVDDIQNLLGLGEKKKRENKPLHQKDKKKKKRKRKKDRK